MTQRTRQAIIEYWLSKHGDSWRRFSRLFFFVSCLMVFSQCASAEEPAMVDKELKAVPAPVKAVLKKAAIKKTAVLDSQETVVTKKPKFQLPDVDEADEKAEGTTKFLKGTVSAKSNFGVALVYGEDPVKGELEMWSEYNKSTKLSGYKNFAAIEEGDKVEIRYKQLKKTGKKRILQEMRLVEKKHKEEAALTESAPQTAKASSLPTVKI